MARRVARRVRASASDGPGDVAQAGRAPARHRRSSRVVVAMASASPRFSNQQRWPRARSVSLCPACARARAGLHPARVVDTRARHRRQRRCLLRHRGGVAAAAPLPVGRARRAAAAPRSADRPDEEQRRLYGSERHHRAATELRGCVAVQLWTHHAVRLPGTRGRLCSGGGTCAIRHHQRAATPGPRGDAGRLPTRRGARRRTRVRVLAEAVRLGRQRPRAHVHVRHHAATDCGCRTAELQVPAGDTRGRDSAVYSAEYPACAAIDRRVDPRGGAAETERNAGRRRERTEGAVVATVGGVPGDERRHRILRRLRAGRARGRCTATAPVAHERGISRAADRVRERRQPAAGARDGKTRRTGVACGAGRRAIAAVRPVAGREPAAGRHVRHRGIALRALGHIGAGHARAHRRWSRSCPSQCPCLRSPMSA